MGNKTDISNILRDDSSDSQPTTRAIPHYQTTTQGSHTTKFKTRTKTRRSRRIWTEADDGELVRLRLSSMKWREISKGFEGKVCFSSRLKRHWKLEEEYPYWNDDKETKLDAEYERWAREHQGYRGSIGTSLGLEYQKDFFSQFAKEINVPLRAVEKKHCQLRDKKELMMGLRIPKG
ncbi:MAG: hypothetical protein Q9220_005877 [cf. Caloplaca sp. 1 TL-2023]